MSPSRATVVARAAEVYARKAAGESPEVTAESIVDRHFPCAKNPALWHNVVSEVIDVGAELVIELTAQGRTKKGPKAKRVPVQYCQNGPCGKPIPKGRSEGPKRYLNRKTCSPECQRVYQRTNGHQQKAGRAAVAAGADSYVPL